MPITSVDVKEFQTLKPWRDLSFWAALGVSIFAALPVVHDAWVSRRADGTLLIAAVAPLTAWLVLHGVLRTAGVTAYGKTTAEVAKANSADSGSTTNTTTINNP